MYIYIIIYIYVCAQYILTDGMSEWCVKVGINRRKYIICSEGFQKLIYDSQNDALWWTWLLVGDTFCTDTCLQPNDVTHRSLYTEQFLRAGILTQGGLCTERLLYTDTFTHRCFYTKKEVFTNRCFVPRFFCAHK